MEGERGGERGSGKWEVRKGIFLTPLSFGNKKILKFYL
jgi:hypothetical protein